MPPSFRLVLSSPRRWWLALVLLALAGLIALIVGVRAASGLVARMSTTTGAAEWIWVERDWRDLTPAAFYLARDFELDAPPARARLLVLGDEEYILYLNGRRIGTGSYRPGAPLDVYEVGPLLQPGLNRLVAELRSQRGNGGFLASLEDPESGRQLARTDESWRIVRRYRLGLVRGWLPLEGPGAVESSPAFSWGRPPLGRWGRLALGTPKPLLFDLRRGQPVAAVSARPFRFSSRVLERPQPPQVLFDWGREVTGHLRLEVPGSDGLRVGLLFTGTELPDPPAAPPAAAILVLPGADRWLDAEPRRFRYALVMGAPGALAARVQPVDPAALLWFPPRQPMRGLLGILPPPLRTPVEDEVWSELQGVPGVAGWEER